MVRPRFQRIACVLAVSLAMFGSLPSVWAQTWNSTISFTGSGDIYSSPPGATALPTTVTVTGTGVTTVTPVGSGEYSVTSVFDISSMLVAITGANSTIPTFDIADGGITLTAPEYTANLVDLSPAPLELSANYAGDVADTEGYPTGGFYVGDNGPQFAYFNGDANFQLGDGSSLTGSSGAFTYANADLSLSVFVPAGIDPVYGFSGSASVTYSLATSVPDSSSLVVEALLVLAFCVTVVRPKAPEAKLATVRRQQ